MAAAHAAAELVEVGQTVVVGLVDEDRVGPGDVEAALDDRGGQEDVDLALHEADHHLLEFGLIEPAMGDPNRGLGHILLDPGGHFVDVVDSVVDKKHLPVAGQLPLDRGPDQ